MSWSHLLFRSEHDVHFAAALLRAHRHHDAVLATLVFRGKHPAGGCRRIARKVRSDLKPGVLQALLVKREYLFRRVLRGEMKAPAVAVSALQRKSRLRVHG